MNFLEANYIWGVFYRVIEIERIIVCMDMYIVGSTFKCKRVDIISDRKLFGRIICDTFGYSKVLHAEHHNRHSHIGVKCLSYDKPLSVGMNQAEWREIGVFSLKIRDILLRFGFTEYGITLKIGERDDKMVFYATHNEIYPVINVIIVVDIINRVPQLFIVEKRELKQQRIQIIPRPSVGRQVFAYIVKVSAFSFAQYLNVEYFGNCIKMIAESLFRQVVPPFVQR